MSCDPPLFEACCFCLPLRGGLIAYGFLRMIILAVFFGLDILFTLGVNELADSDDHQWMIIPIVFAIIITVDVGFTIAFLYGSFNRRTKPLQVFMWYLTVNAILSLVAFVVQMTSNEVPIRSILPAIFQNVLQFYIIFCIRSHIVELRNREDTGVNRFNVKAGGQHC